MPGDGAAPPLRRPGRRGRRDPGAAAAGARRRGRGRPAGRADAVRRRGHRPRPLRRRARAADRQRARGAGHRGVRAAGRGPGAAACRCSGICRGLQVINVARGGTPAPAPARRGRPRRARPGAGHLRLAPGAGRARAASSAAILGREEVDVPIATPTHHHQAVDRLGERADRDRLGRGRHDRGVRARPPATRSCWPSSGTPRPATTRACSGRWSPPRGTARPPPPRPDPAPAGALAAARGACPAWETLYRDRSAAGPRRSRPVDADAGPDVRLLPGRHQQLRGRPATGRAAPQPGARGQRLGLGQPGVPPARRPVDRRPRDPAVHRHRAGLPTQGNTHDLVQQAAPGARVVYVDNDPMVLAHGRVLLGDSANTTIVMADLRDPDSVLSHPDLLALIDLREPVGLLLTGGHVLRGGRVRPLGPGGQVRRGDRSGQLSRAVPSHRRQQAAAGRAGRARRSTPGPPRTSTSGRGPTSSGSSRGWSWCRLTKAPRPRSPTWACGAPRTRNWPTPTTRAGSTAEWRCDRSQQMAAGRALAARYP